MWKIIIIILVMILWHIYIIVYGVSVIKFRKKKPTKDN